MLKKNGLSLVALMFAVMLVYVPHSMSSRAIPTLLPSPYVCVVINACTMQLKSFPDHHRFSLNLG